MLGTKASFYLIIVSVLLIAMNSISIQCSNNCADYKEKYPTNFKFSVLCLIVSICLLIGGFGSLYLANTPMGRINQFTQFM